MNLKELDQEIEAFNKRRKDNVPMSTEDEVLLYRAKFLELKTICKRLMEGFLVDE